MADIEKILVADDEEADRFFFEDLLKQDGFSPIVVNSGTQACERLEQQNFDVVITDLVMPGATGFDVLRTARKTNPEAICIVLTSFGSLDTAIDALNLGAYSYLLKPCDAAAFRHCLARGLEKQRLTKELRLRNEQLEKLNRELDAKVIQATSELRGLNERMLTEMASLKEIDELKTAFLNNVSHDLKNPITTISGYVSCLLDDPNSGLSAENRKALEKVLGVSAHMSYLISQLLEAAKLTSGHIKLDLSTFKVSELLDAACALVKPQAQTGGLELTLECPEDWDLKADRGRLLQVLGNLLGNACKFTPKGGRVRLSARKSAGAARFEVTDTGPGIAPEHHSRIFDKFFQIDSSLSRPFKGLGLGLHIAQDIVRLHGGKLGVDSTPRKGSRFFFEIPIAVPAHIA